MIKGWKRAANNKSFQQVNYTCFHSLSPLGLDLSGAAEFSQMDVHHVSLHPTLDLRESAPSSLDAIHGFFHECSRLLFIPGVFLPNRYVQNMAFINTHQLGPNPGLCFVPVSEVHPFFSLLLSLIKRNVPLEPWLCTSAVQDCVWQSTRTCIDSRMKSTISCKVLLNSEQKHLRTIVPQLQRTSLVCQSNSV